MNVRIGNDIRLNLTLKGGQRNYDQANIKLLRAYLINTSLKDFNHISSPCVCRRFPNEPNPFFPEVSHDCIGICGKPGYHAKPWHHCCGRGPAGGRVPFNPAFGEGPLRPNYGHPWHCYDHAWCPGCCGHCAESCCTMYPVNPLFPHVECDFKYLAPSRVLPGQNQIQVYFPAHDQFSCGDYKLVVVLVAYEAGWGHCNLHHYTIDYGKVLTLVDDNTGVDGDILIDVDNDSLKNTGIIGVNMINKNFHMYSNSNLKLGEEDLDNTLYTISVDMQNGATMDYDPNNWPFNGKLQFQSSNPEVLEVLADGTLVSKKVNEDYVVTVTVTYGAAGEFFSAGMIQFKVLVEGAIQDYIGYLNIKPTYGIFSRPDERFESAEQEVNPCYTYSDSRMLEAIAQGKLTAVEDIAGSHDVNCTQKGSYLWILSRKPIRYAGVGELKMPLGAQDTVLNNKWYCYYCPNPTSVVSNVNVTVVV